jgi:3-hydroxymyristoyl/3-hydroxydecanoyl-(acyl carrier protein) dehydratase
VDSGAEHAARSTADFAIHDYITHRAPILGVDRIREIGDQWVVAERLVEPGPELSADGLLWEGVLIEGLAQTASVLHARAAHLESRRVARGMLVGLSHLVFHRHARAGELVEYRIELTRLLEPVSLMHGVARVGAEVLAEGDLKFYIEQVPGEATP